MTYGNQSGRLQFSHESTWGTPTTSWLTLGHTTRFSDTSSNALLQSNTIGRINARRILEGKYEGRFTVEWEEQGGPFLVACLGDYDTTSPVTNGSNYIHYGCMEDSTSTETTPVEHEPQPFTFQAGLDGSTDRVKVYEGCFANTLTLTFDMDSPLRISADAIARKVDISTATAATVTEIADGPYMWHNNGTLNINSVAQADVTSLTATINNNVTFNWGVLPSSDKRCPVGYNVGPREVTGTVTLNFDDFDLYELFLDSAGSPTVPGDDTVSQFPIDLTLDNAVSPTTDATYRGIFFDIKSCKFDTSGWEIPNTSGPVTATFNFRARQFDYKYYNATGSDSW